MILTQIDYNSSKDETTMKRSSEDKKNNTELQPKKEKIDSKGEPVPVIDLTDGDDDEALENVRTIQGMMEAEFDEMLQEIRTAHSYLPDRPMEAFINVVNRNHHPIDCY